MVSLTAYTFWENKHILACKIKVNLRLRHVLKKGLVLVAEERIFNEMFCLVFSNENLRFLILPIFPNPCLINQYSCHWILGKESLYPDSRQRNGAEKGSIMENLFPVKMFIRIVCRNFRIFHSKLRKSVPCQLVIYTLLMCTSSKIHLMYEIWLRVNEVWN